MGVLEIKSFNGGYSDFQDRGTPGSFLQGFNLNIRKFIDSLTCNQALKDEGIVGSDSHSPSLSASPSASVSISPSSSASPSAHPGSASLSPSASRSPSASISPSYSLSPSPSPSFADNSWFTVFRDLIKFFVKCSDGYTYGFGDAGYIYRRDADGFWMFVYKDPNGAIKGAAEKPSSDGRKWLYWATDKIVMRKLIPGRQDWNDPEQVGSNLDPADWHTMKEVGGSLMIANRNKLAMVGYDDSYTNEALDLIPGNIATTLVERNGRVIVGTRKESDITAGINAAIDSEVPLAQIGNNGDLFFTNISQSMPVNHFPFGGKVNPGGVVNQTEDVNFFEWEQTALSWLSKQTVGNLALFAVYGASSGIGIYSFGRKRKNAPFVLNCEYLTGLGSNDELGALTYVGGKALVSYKFAENDGSFLYGVYATDVNNKAQAYYYSLECKAPTKLPIQITNWKQVELIMSPLPEGCSVQLSYIIDRGNTRTAYTADGLTAYSYTNSTKAVFRMNEQGERIIFIVTLNPSGNSTPEVLELRALFD